MTKVSLTVTKDLAEVPEEVSKQLSTVIDMLQNTLENLKVLQRGAKMGMSMEKMSKSILEEITNMDPINILCQDVYNICASFAKIEEDKNNQEQKEMVDEKIKSSIAALKFEAESKIGQMIANNKLLEDQIKNLTTKLEEKNQTPPSFEENVKSSKKKSTRKK